MGKSGTLLPVYLVKGTNELKRDAALRRIRSRQDPGLQAFNLDEVSAASLDLDVLKASLEALPVGDQYRIVIIHEAERLTKDAERFLADYLKNPNPTTVLLLSMGELPKGSRFSSSALYKAIKAVGPSSIIDCAPPKPYQLPDHLVKDIAPSCGVTLDRNAAEELVRRSGTSIRLLQNQIVQLSNLASEPGHIRLKDVEAHIEQTEDVKPWDLADAVSARDAKKALAYAAQIDARETVRYLSYLADRVRELICAKCLAERGEADRVAMELHKQAWQVKNYAGWVRRFSEAELVEALRICARGDRALKTGSDARGVLVDTIVGICRVSR